MKAEEIRNLSDKERQEKIADLRQEYFNLKFQLASGKIENPSRLRLIRRDIARVRTIQQEGQGGTPAPAPAAKEAGGEKEKEKQAG